MLNVLAALLVGPAHAACDDCPPALCVAPGPARAERERKKREAAAFGLPPRLQALYDGLPDCLHCVETSPDWPTLVITDRDGDPFEISWTRHGEQLARDALANGEIRGFRILLTVKACTCCRDGRPAPSEPPALVFADAGALGQAPGDLTEAPPVDELPIELILRSLPPLEVVRPVTVRCPACQALAERHNSLAEQANALAAENRADLKQLRFNDAISLRALDRFQVLGEVVETPRSTAEERATLETARLTRAEANRLRRRLAEREAAREAVVSGLIEAYAAVAECDARPCAGTCPAPVSPGAAADLVIPPLRPGAGGAMLRGRASFHRIDALPEGLTPSAGVGVGRLNGSTCAVVGGPCTESLTMLLAGGGLSLSAPVVATGGGHLGAFGPTRLALTADLSLLGLHQDLRLGATQQGGWSFGVVPAIGGAWFLGPVGLTVGLQGIPPRTELLLGVRVDAPPKEVPCPE